MKIVHLLGYNLFYIVVGENKSTCLHRDESARSFLEVSILDMDLTAEQFQAVVTVITSRQPAITAERVGVAYEVM